MIYLHQWEILQLSISRDKVTKKNLIVGQSGGPTAVINSSLYGVVSEELLILMRLAKFTVW